MEKGVLETYLVAHFLGTKYGNGNHGLRHADPLVSARLRSRGPEHPEKLRPELTQTEGGGVGGRVGEASSARCGREQSVWAGPQGDLECGVGACGRGHRHKLQEGWKPAGGERGGSSCARRGRSLGRVLREGGECWRRAGVGGASSARRGRGRDVWAVPPGAPGLRGRRWRPRLRRGRREWGYAQRGVSAMTAELQQDDAAGAADGHGSVSGG